MPEHILARFGAVAGDENEASFMLDAMRAFDWEATSAGSIAAWDAPLKDAARLMLLAATPMALLLGRQALLTYNDAMRALFGAHYDGSLGRPVEETLPEAAQFCREAVDRCHAGRSCRFEDQPLPLRRDGEWKTAWFNLSFTPVADVQGRVSGVLVIANETTSRVNALRDLQRTQRRLDIALDVSGIGAWDIDVATNRLTCDARCARLFAMTPEEARIGVDNDTLVDLIDLHEREAVRAALASSMRSGADYHRRYRLTLPDGGQRWYLDAGRAVRDAAGRIERLTGVVIDLTSQVSVEDALYESEARFRALVESIPQIIWSTTGDGRHDYFSSRWTEFTGLDPETVAHDEWQRLVHPEDWSFVAERWADCLATGKPYDVEYRFRHRSGDYRWLRVMALPLRDRHGAVVRWYGTSTDIEDQRRLVDERELVANELEHRIRNIFALVNGLVALSVREHPDSAPVARDFQQRLSALHRAHGFIRARDQGANHPGSVQALIRTLLEPYDDGSGRIELTGDDTELAEALVTPLTLVLHELASNAAKYGALSASPGRLSVRLRCDGQQLKVTWKETTSAKPDAAKGGYGSRLLALTIERQLRGSYSRTFSTDGLLFEFAIPAPRPS